MRTWKCVRQNNRVGYVYFKYSQGTLSLSLEHYKDNIICVPTDEFSSVNFEITAEERQALMDRAGAQARAFLRAWSTRPPARRYSIG